MTRIWSSLVVHEKITIFLLSNIFIVKITDTSYIPRVRPYNDRPPEVNGTCLWDGYKTCDGLVTV